MSAHSGGWKNINAVITHYKKLKQQGLSHQHILKMASMDGGANNVSAVVQSVRRLNRFGCALEDIVKIVSRHGGAGRIRKMAELADQSRLLRLSAKDIVSVACRDIGKINLEFMLKNYIFFRKRRYRKKDILAILRRRGGVKKLLYILKKRDFLNRSCMSPSQIGGIFLFSKGYQNMTSFVRLYSRLKPYCSLFRIAQSLNSEDGGANLKQLLKESQLKAALLSYRPVKIVKAIYQEGKTVITKSQVRFVIQVTWMTRIPHHKAMTVIRQNQAIQMQEMTVIRKA